MEGGSVESIFISPPSEKSLSRYISVNNMLKVYNRPIMNVKKEKTLWLLCEVLMTSGIRVYTHGMIPVLIASEDILAMSL